MKGGITSGLVYPTTVCRLAKTYRFVNIGGTSAGAIGAAATAAAEYRRAEGSADAFEKLSQLPAFLAAKPGGGKHTNLFSLFQPDGSARMLFEFAVALTHRGLHRLVAVFMALIKGAWFVWAAVLLLAALYLFLPTLAPIRQSNFDRVSVAAWLIGMLATGLTLVVFAKIRLLPPKGFGLCSGMTQRGEATNALTAWFHGFLNDLAGKPFDQPLTFGDLNAKGIQLRMISTCLTHRRPYGLPIDSKQFYFKASELADYFPEAVIRWMEDHSGTCEKDAPDVDETGFCRLPQPSEMPVVVAVRMSLSYPVLFRAVPLYAVDFSLARLEKADPSVDPEPGSPLQPGELRKPERCWFLDGGICSNFPIYMFDSLLPRWPTFGINLQAIRKDRPDSIVWMPSRNAEGFGEQFARIPAKNGLGPMVEYAAGMIDAARNWSESRQMTAPGYRDRIVHIRLNEGKEGGLNLDMNSAVVAELSDRGLKAADLLLSHFLHPNSDVSLTWDNHRWIRFRSSLARLEDTLKEISHGISEPEIGELSYQELLDRGPNESPSSYRVTEQQRAFIHKWLDQLIAAARAVEIAPENNRPSYKEPRPTPTVRVLPRIVPDIDADRPSTPTVDPETEGRSSVS